MILELEFNNYKMFKGKNILSFNADTRIKRLGSNYVNVLNRNVLKSISLYGQNNIGKSNLLLLFKLIKSLMLGVENIVFNRELFGDAPECDVSITYKTEIDKNWMKYSFTYDSLKGEIAKETLSEVVFYETGNSSSKIIYKRDKKNDSLTIFNENHDELSKLLPSKKAFLYCVSLENKIFEPLKNYLESFKNFANSLEIVQLFNIPIEKTINVLKGNNRKEQEFISEFIKYADLLISDFFYSKDFIAKNDNEGEIKEEVLKKIDVIDKFKLFTKYGDKQVPSLLYDSSGTKKIEAIASYVYDSIVNGKTLIIDELDSGLHFKLSRVILSIFNSFANEKGQLVFTAYDIALISCKSLMRKDQIYFPFRNEASLSYLYCLKEASVSEGGPRSTEELLTHYNRGEFGYVPTPNFTKLLSTLKNG